MRGACRHNLSFSGPFAALAAVAAAAAAVAAVAVATFAAMRLRTALFAVTAGRTAVGICSQYYVSGLSLGDCVWWGMRAAETIKGNGGAAALV